jgi:hypothetical protein
MPGCTRQVARRRDGKTGSVQATAGFLRYRMPQILKQILKPVGRVKPAFPDLPIMVFRDFFHLQSLPFRRGQGRILHEVTIWTIKR